MSFWFHAAVGKRSFHGISMFLFYFFRAAVQEILLEAERNKQRANDYGSLAWYAMRP